MFDTPTRRYRPIRNEDGEGTGESLGTPTTLWVDIVPHDNQVQVVYDGQEDVAIGDLLLVPFS